MLISVFNKKDFLSKAVLGSWKIVKVFDSLFFMVIVSQQTKTNDIPEFHMNLRCDLNFNHELMVYFQNLPSLLTLVTISHLCGLPFIVLIISL